MSFLHPEFLYYMLIPLFVLFGFLLTQKEAQFHFFSDDVMDKLRVNSNMMTMKARNGLFLLIGFLIIVALSAPVINDGEVEVKAKSSDIIIALDISDSMLAEDVYPNRLKLAKQKAGELLKSDSKERIGIVAFAKNSYLVSPLSFDYSAVRFLLSSLNTDSITEKGTDIMSLLEVVADSSEKKQKHLLVLSDGGDKSDLSDEIAYAKENDIVVFVLAIGTKKGSPIKLKNGEYIKYKGDIIVSKLNETISTLATSTGGVYIQSVNSDADIKTMLQEIKSKTDAKELKSQKVQKYIPLFYYPLGLALFILLIATSSMSKRATVNLPSIFVIAVLFFASSDLNAQLLDFMKLKDAKNAYQDGRYGEASSIYEIYSKESNSAQGFFNAGNAYYKDKKYDKAIESYEKSVPESSEFLSKKYANMGNAYAMQNNLQKAKDFYEKSLKLQEDKQVRENLEEVKKALKENTKEEEKQNKQDKDSNEKKDNSETKEDKKDSSKDSKESKTKSDKEDSKENEIQKTEPDKDEMSESEEKKWLQRLNRGQSTYMYKLNKDKNDEESYDEKPW